MLIKNSEFIVPVADEGMACAPSRMAFISATGKSSDHEIGRRIRSLRIEKGLNQQQLGAFIGVSGQQMQKYECAKNNLSVAKLLEIARVLGGVARLSAPSWGGYYRTSEPYPSAVY